MLQESIGKERRPITWAAGDQTVVKPQKISMRDQLTAQRIQATELREPKEHLGIFYKNLRGLNAHGEDSGS